MKDTPSAARILVASDSPSDAEQIVNLLSEHFQHVNKSINGDNCVRDFDSLKPDVLVLGFNTIEKAQRYYLGLYRFGPSLQERPHRTVLLCSKDELSVAFTLCKQQYFDDYVLFWPHANDGLRLPMSIWVAGRELLASREKMPQRSDLLLHASQLGALEHTLNRELSACEDNVEVAHRSLTQLERDLASATDEFSDRLSHTLLTPPQERAQSETLVREIGHLKQQQLAQTRLARSRGLEPLTAWTREAKKQIEPAIAGTQELAHRIQQIPRVLMLVDDDELTMELVTRALATENIEVVYAGDGNEALRALRRICPDIILMDIQMPGLDGISLTRSMKASPPPLADTPIIMMTGDARRESVVRSMEAGAIDFIVKPFTREALMAKLDKFCRREPDPGLQSRLADILPGDGGVQEEAHSL